MNKKIAAVLIFCVPFYVTALAYHHHEDNAAHDGCGLCLCLSLHSGLILPSLYHVSAPTLNLAPIPVETATDVSNSYRGPHSDRAPPLS
jgi:hypothetical protein